jgi:Kef-type K+ transport system membrane component KefB
MDTGRLLVHLLVFVGFAVLAAELSERVGIPTVVGEILAGVAVGPSLLGLVGHDEVLAALGEIGLVLLLLDVGLHMQLRELAEVGRVALTVALVGVLAPLVGGYAAGEALGLDGHQPLFLAAALTATSVGITARVLGDLRALATPEARTVLGAAVADDVMGLVVLTVVVRVVRDGSVSLVGVAGVLGLAVAFLVVVAGAGTWLAPRLVDGVRDRSCSAGSVVGVALALTFGMSRLAGLAGLAPVVGAFLAGLSVAPARAADDLRRDLAPINRLLVPVFFLQVGVAVDVSALARPSALALAAALLGVGVTGKLLAGLVVPRGRGDRLLVGIGMVPRGEVGLIFAGIGLREGVLDGSSYAALLLAVLLTTLLTPPLLARRFERVRAQRSAAPADPRPDAGWLTVDADAVVDLAATPPTAELLGVVLESALRFASARRPGPRLLDWISAAGDVPVRWDRRTRELFFQLLRQGDVRSWRFLEQTAVLDRGLPELATALAHRRSDLSDLDPAGSLRWALVDQVRRAAQRDPAAHAGWSQLSHPERVLLAALVLECVGAHASPVLVARRIVQRLDLGVPAEQDVAALVADRGLLRAVARRVEGLQEESVLAVAVHLATVERVHALHVLTVADGDLEVWERQQVDELAELVVTALGRRDVTGRDARNLVERRRAQARALVAGRDARERIDAAPREYVLSQQPADIARHAAVLDPLPRQGHARVAVSPAAAGGGWLVDVGLRDTAGLLARVTGALHDLGLDVQQAVVATWGDGAALESFVVSGAGPLEAGVLTREIETALGTRLAAYAVPDAVLEVDQSGSPWHTLCSVATPDRRGALHDIAAAFACSDVEVHSAAVSSDGRIATARFALSDRAGGKLGDASVERVRTTLREGARARRIRRTHTDGTSPKQAGHDLETTHF